MRKFSKFILLLLSLVLFVTLAACGKKIELSFADEQVPIKVDEVFQLDVIVVGEVTELEWSSSDDTVVSVSASGEIKGLKVGEVTITVKVKDKDIKATIIVKVDPKPVVLPTSVVIVNGPESVKVGQVIQLTASVLPATASQEVTWSTSNAQVATVDTTGKVTFLSIGNVVITAKAKAKDTIKRDLSINVVAPDPTEIIVASQTGVASVMLFEKLQMLATVNPAIAVKTVIWSVSDTSVATISETGLLDAKKVGKVTVTAKSTVNQDIFGTMEIEVALPAATSLTVTAEYNVIQIEEQLALVCKVLPEMASQAVTYSSSDDAIATVDAGGKVVGVAAGEATITVTSVSNENVSKTFVVKVIEKLAEPTHVNFLVDESLKTAERYSKVTLGEDEYILGLNAFSDFSNFKLSDDSKIFVKKGTYVGSILINKNNVEIYSENADKNPNTAAFKLDAQAILTGKITIENAVEGLTINGLSFTDTAKVEAKETIKEFIFSNNYVFDTVKATKAWSAARDYTLTGFLTLWKQAKEVSLIYIKNNKFSNVSETNIIVGNTKGLLIENNTFTNFERDAIRIDGGNNYSLTLIKGNTFKNDNQGGYNGIYFRAIGVYAQTEDQNIVEIKENHFENIGTSEVFSGAISTNGYQEFGSTVNIHHNKFVNCVDYIWLRNNATAANHAAHQWVGNINYNIFLGVPETYYHRNLNPANSADTEITNPTMVNMDFNFYGDLEGNPIDLTDDAIKAKFFSVASLKYSYTSIDAMSAYFVNSAWSDKQENDELEYDGMKFIYGVNGFFKIQDAINAAKVNGIVIVLPGTYDEEVDIKKPVQLRTLNANLNPALDDAAFLATADSSVLITNVWYLNNVSNVSIKGFTFTGAARIRQYGAANSAGTSGFVFSNNYVFDTNAATLAWKQTAYATYGTDVRDNTTIPGFLSLAQNGTWMGSPVVTNNKFTNVSDTNVYLISVSGATITGNIFSGGERDAIRLDYGTLYGTFNIKDNIIENYKYNGIYVRTYAWSYGAVIFNIENNLFKNLGAMSLTETPASTRIGAIATSGYSESNAATFNIRFNRFENNYNYISLRANVTNVATFAQKAFTWTAVIEYNSFIDSDGVAFYFRNLLNAADTALTNIDNAIIDKNFYGTDANTKAEINAAQFDHHKADLSNLVVYNTLAELEEAILGYYDFIKPILVDPSLADVDAGTKLVYEGSELEVGKSAFATLKDAVEAAVAGKTIIVLAGTYTEETISVTVNNLTIIGPNFNVDPNNKERKPEAIVQAIISIEEGVKNTIINGFTLNYNSTTSFVTGSANGNIEGFKFLYNIVHGGSGAGSMGAIRFIQASAEKGNKDFTFSYNYFHGMRSDRVMRISFIENLTINNNKFEDNSTDVIRLNDNGGSVTGFLVLKDNVFLKTGQFALFTAATTVKSMTITGNTFETSGSSYPGGALSIRKLTVHADGTTILIDKNIFKDSRTNDIRIDHEFAEDANATITISNNEFYTPETLTTIYTNTLTGAAKTIFKLNNKVYDPEGVLVVELAPLFEGETPRIKNASLEVQ